ncbi:gyrA, partial [Symbiodinium sp. KB8]
EQVEPANSDPGPCVLLVTKCGLGARIPLSSKRIGLGRRGGVPKRVLKVADHDSVAAACVVSGKDIREPEKPLGALQLYLKDHGDSTEAIFDNLPQEDMMPYQEQEDEAKRKYEEALEAFRQEDCEEVLLGNTGGAVTRIKVSTVPIVTRLNRGRLLAKTKGSDRICVASLLSSIEDDQDETGKEPAKSTPSNLAASRLRRAADRLADSAGSSLRGSEAAASEAAQKAEVPVPLPVERTPRSKLTQSLAKRRRSSNMSSPRRSPQSAVPSSIRLLKPKLRVLKSPFYAKRMLPRVFMFDLNLRRFVLSNE